MEMNNICQSCSMPLDDPQLRGSEKDGSQSAEYCKYCYTNGAFTNPDLSMNGMIEVLTKLKESKRLPAAIVQQSVAILPGLKRWKKESVGT